MERNIGLRERCFTIDMLKFLATLFIFNHLSGPLYGRYAFLGTGGTIGVSLFFFCSGYALAMGRLDRFDNWYKRRVARVWPTCFVVVALFSLCHVGDGLVVRAFLGDGWFIRYILVAYVIFYLVRRWCIPYWLAYGLSVVATIMWYCRWLPYNEGYVMFGGSLFRFVVLIGFMFWGAIFATSFSGLKVRAVVSLPVALVSFSAFNILVFLIGRNVLPSSYQILVLVPLTVSVLSLYVFIDGVAEQRFFQHPWTKNVVLLVGGLCLEMYLACRTGLVQTTYFNFLFPLNLVINLVCYLAFAYVVRCLARLFSQTFQRGEYDWSAIFKLI